MRKTFSSDSDIVKRYLLLLAGLTIMSFGIALSIKADLGTSPISSAPYVISMFAPLSVGTVTILMHCIFILLQILILRKNYELIQLMQLPVAIIFGWLNDFALMMCRSVECNSYIQQWIFCTAGILLVAIGVSFEVKAKVLVLAGEGVVLALCQVLPVKFGHMKVAFDVTLVAIACVLSFTFLHGLYGVREGTLAAALFVGVIARYLGKLMDGWKLGEESI